MKTIVFIFCSLLCFNLFAQNNEIQIKQLVKELYNNISFNENKAFEDSLLRTKFVDDAIMIQSNGKKSQNFKLDDYINSMQNAQQTGAIKSFEEIGFITKVEVHGTIAHAFGSYETLILTEKDEHIKNIGINSFSLVKEADGWKVYALSWIDQGENYTLPDQYHLR